MPKMRTRHAESAVHGYHVYMDWWDSGIGQKFDAEIKAHNKHNWYAMALKVHVDGMLLATP